ncbi:hypothetical protein SCHPADRAFT_889545 [Schizopora paradoxa]|uniref:Uncharacterized protein n=1 Tax=Schizopora paradoxa TaxID=27342 RepID=A0A0H2RQ23_9AGAM|nr:hypothetical protein SCHPADRAFT_889545 [Schizopora paradoxa]
MFKQAIPSPILPSSVFVIPQSRLLTYVSTGFSVSSKQAGRIAAHARSFTQPNNRAPHERRASNPPSTECTTKQDEKKKDENEKRQEERGKPGLKLFSPELGASPTSPTSGSPTLNEYTYRKLCTTKERLYADRSRYMNRYMHVAVNIDQIPSSCLLADKIGWMYTNNSTFDWRAPLHRLTGHPRQARMNSPYISPPRNKEEGGLKGRFHASAG